MKEYLKQHPYIICFVFALIVYVLFPRYQYIPFPETQTIYRVDKWTQTISCAGEHKCHLNFK